MLFLCFCSILYRLLFSRAADDCDYDQLIRCNRVLSYDQRDKHCSLSGNHRTLHVEVGLLWLVFLAGGIGVAWSTCSASTVPLVCLLLSRQMVQRRLLKDLKQENSQSLEGSNFTGCRNEPTE